jgi:plastocyanin
VLAAALCAVALAPASVPAAGRSVKVGDDFYKARKLRVKPGTTVTWRWAGHSEHDVYFTRAPRKGKPRSCKAKTEGSCSRRIRKRGTYDYVCTLHGSMSGRIVAR